MGSTYFVDVKGWIKILLALLLASITGNFIQWQTRPEEIQIDASAYIIQLKEKDRTISSLRNTVSIREAERDKYKKENQQLKKDVAQKETKYIEVVKIVKTPDTVGENCISEYKTLYSTWQICDELREYNAKGWQRCEQQLAIDQLNEIDLNKIIAEREKQLSIYKNWNEELTKQKKICHCSKACIIAGAISFGLGTWIAH